MKVTIKQAKELAKKFNINLKVVPLKYWQIGLNTELEHGTKLPLSNITNNDLILTAKIVIAHLSEYPDYYQRLEIMEEDAKEAWKGIRKPNIYKK